MKTTQLKALLISIANLTQEIHDGVDLTDTELLDLQYLWERMQIELNTLCWALVDRRKNDEQDG